MHVTVTDSRSGVRSAGRGHSVANRVIPAILRTPVLHRLLSRNLMLVTFTGRKSRRTFTTPVTYTPTETGVLFFSNQRWWTNLRGGAPVVLHLQGSAVTGVAEPVEEPATVAREVRAYLRRRGSSNADKIGVALPGSGDPSDAELAAAVRSHVVVYVALDQE